MTLDEFVADMRQRLEDFEQNWRRNNSLNAEHYPLEMEEGAWDQQWLATEYP